MTGLAAAIVLLHFAPASGAYALRHTGALAGEPEGKTVKEIQENYDKMDEFVGIMFKLACGWQHSKDVNGLAAHKLKEGDIKQADVNDFKLETQAKNVKAMKASCGMIVSKQEPSCRQSCAKRWGVAKGQRAECDKKCVDVYTHFEKQCLIKAENLKSVYDAKRKAAQAREMCHVGHCKIFPSVWTQETEADRETEATKQCENRCTEDRIKAECEKRWALQVDFVKVSLKANCTKDSEAKSCYSKEKTTISADHDTCSSDGKGTCETQKTECETKGKTDSAGADAQIFCDKRHRMCEEQVVADCLKKHEKALDAAKTKCEKEDEELLKTCVDTKLDEKETEMATKCETKKTESCPEDCLKKCDTKALSECLDNLKGGNDEGKLFCDDMWDLLSKSSEVDEKTGDPKVVY